jgi:mono/diheme cytochrome c family protein
MLRRFDSWLAIATWIVAGLFVLMLLAGPTIVAEDKGKPVGAAAYVGGGAGGGGGADGKQVFTSNCGSCHTLSKAGTTGAVGPNLDNVALDAQQVADKVKSGGGVMPAFQGKLSDAEIQAVAAYVSGR